MTQTPSLSDLPITHHFGGGVYSKETRVAAGLILVQHKHEHDRLSILACGTVEVLIDGVHSELTGPACLTIKAGKHHGVKAQMWAGSASTRPTALTRPRLTRFAEDVFRSRAGALKRSEVRTDRKFSIETLKADPVTDRRTVPN